MSEPQPKKRRIRKRSVALRLEQALNDAEAAMTADVTVQRLCTTRIMTLNKMLAREGRSKVKALEQALAEARAEIERLQQELARAKMPASEVSEPTDVLSQALQKYEQERRAS
jgi:septal ring factor EnvC (AmiA/AmiB activator)